MTGEDLQRVRMRIEAFLAYNYFEKPLPTKCTSRIDLWLRCRTW